MRDIPDLTDRMGAHLRALTSHPDRHVGGPGNRAATGYFADEMAALGLRVRREEMQCFEWEPHEAFLEIGGERVELHVGPYSLSCDVSAPLVSVSSVEELETERVRGAIVLLHGPIAAGQYMPRNFTFYNPESHQRVYRAIDAFAPAAIVAATGHDAEMVGSQYPFPLFEDGDLDVPSAYLTDVDGERLVGGAGERARLVVSSERIRASAEHVVATLPGTGEGRLVITAHIDSRRGSPGALDNATGVGVLLGVAELLRDYSCSRTIEFIPFNGEDDYANPGELQWIAENTGRFDEIVLGINIDDASQVGADNDVSFYGCPPAVESAVRRALDGHERIGEGAQWFQGDHSILGIYGRPAIAIASSAMMAFMAEYAHTERDVPELADCELMAETSRFIARVVELIAGRTMAAAV